MLQREDASRTAAAAMDGQGKPRHACLRAHRRLRRGDVAAGSHRSPPLPCLRARFEQPRQRETRKKRRHLRAERHGWLRAASAAGRASPLVGSGRHSVPPGQTPLHARRREPPRQGPLPRAPPARMRADGRFVASVFHAASRLGAVLAGAEAEGRRCVRARRSRARRRRLAMEDRASGLVAGWVARKTTAFSGSYAGLATDERRRRLSLIEETKVKRCKKSTHVPFSFSPRSFRWWISICTLAVQGDIEFLV